MSSNPKQEKLNRERGVKKLREEFGLRESKSYMDYLKEGAKAGNKNCKKTIRELKKRKKRSNREINLI